MSEGWNEFFQNEVKLEYYQALMATVQQAYQNRIIFPEERDLFRCFELTPYNEVKVVILGQDPYHEENQAHGLCFSVSRDVKIPPSLRNIYMELQNDLNITPCLHGDLTSWANQGVLLLNTILTVEKGKALSHKGLGWEIFTDHVLSYLNQREKPMVFVLWGNPAKQKRQLLTGSHHLILTSAHPSPLSSFRDFFGSRPFSRINDFLIRNHIQPIQWQLEETSMFHYIDELIDSIITRTAHKTDLTRIQTYLEANGNPQNKLRCIHVAGTNGKGSTTNYIRSMLQSAGYKVGSFTSPHLEKHQDRIRINDISIDDETFLSYGNQYDQQWLDYGLNMFEIDFFVSLLYFNEHQVDFAVYEVGMGGRLDSTNTILPLVSVITNIGMDHMEYLGDTYAKIAAEKAGIVKPGIPLITTNVQPECLEVFQAVCTKNKSPLIQIQQPINISYPPVTFQYRHYSDLQLGHVAFYQLNNASLALETIHYLNEQHHIAITLEQIQQGLRTIWRGRFEQMANNPLTFVDGAHNLEGIQALCETLAYFPQKKTIIFCAMKDKPIYPMLQELLKHTDDITLTQFDNPRAFQVQDFDGSLPISLISSYTDAIDQALSKQDNMIVITGSLYFITEAREYLKRKESRYGNHH